MVAYSFQQRFGEPILSSRKTQTIRGQRKRHARPGEELQLYVGMRTRKCRLLARATCLTISLIKITFDAREYGIGQVWVADRTVGNLDAFAQRDGFADFADMCRFWTEHHGLDRDGAYVFEGVIVEWSSNSLRDGEFAMRNAA